MEPNFLRVSLSGVKKPTELSVMNTEFLGHGFNILDGRIKLQIFDSMNVDYQPEMSPTSSEVNSRMQYYRNYADYEKELSVRVGLKPEEVCGGMWTMAQPCTSINNGAVTEQYYGTISRTRSTTKASTEGYGSLGRRFSSNMVMDPQGRSSVKSMSYSQPGEDMTSFSSVQSAREEASAPEEPSSGRSRSSSIENASVSHSVSSDSGKTTASITRSRSGSVAASQFLNQRLIYPFLTGVDKLTDYQHFIQEVEHPLYTLSIKELRGLNVDNVSPAPTQLPPDGRFHTGLAARIQREEDRVINTFLQQIRANGQTVTSDFSFRDETKPGYYQLIERIGTHFISSLTFGRKAEYRWSLQDKQAKDAMTKITSQQKYRKRFMNAVAVWLSEDMSIAEINGDSTDKSELKKVKLPKHCSESIGVTPNFHLKSPIERMSSARPFAFKLESITQLFPVSAPGRITRSDMELAIEVYLEEMKPFRDVAQVKDGSVVSIYAPEFNTFVELTSGGHLVLKLHVNPSTNRCASGVGIPAECQFEVKKKGTKIGLKSMRWNKKFVSRAMTKSSFHFHRLQFMGPHESFEMTGEYLQTGGTLGYSFLSCSSNSTSNVEASVNHDGSFRKKLRLLLVDPTARHAKAEEGSEEPIYEEDDATVQLSITISDGSSSTAAGDEATTAAPPVRTPASDPLTPFKIPSGIVHVVPAHLRTAKSNSTSSLFVKDTILLPNIDQLTKGMAGCIRILIEEGHAQRGGELMEIFSEEKYPLTRQNFNFSSMPSVETIYHFLNTIFKVEKLPAEPGIMCLIYMRRLIIKARLKLHASNWRRVSLSALILASKVWEDQAVWNVDFIELFPNVTVQDLNRLEKYILKVLEFNVSIKSSEYVKIYFELREFTDHIDARDPSTRPLGETGLQQLEIRSASSERSLTMKEVKKTGSLALIDNQRGKKEAPHGPRGVLS